MSSLRPVRVSLAVLAASLLLNVLLVSCAADPTGLSQGDLAEVVARLEAMTARLDSIERKLDRHREEFTVRTDSITAKIVAVGNGATPAPLQVAQIDSILDLASYLATDASTGGWEFCGGAGLALKGNAVTKGEAEGKARGSLGAWAGTGGFAGADLTLKREYAFEIGLEVPFSITGCIPVGGTAPRARTLMAQRAQAGASSLQSTLSGIASQFNLTEARVETSLNTLGTAFSSPGSLRIQDATNLLPLPSGLSSVLNDPVGSLSSELPGKIDDALSALCTGNWGARVSTPLNTACDRIQSNSVDIGGLFNMMEQFPIVQNGLSTVTGVVSIVCGRVNFIGTRSLTIPNPLDIGPTNLFGPERLFPAYTTIGC